MRRSEIIIRLAGRINELREELAQSEARLARLVGDVPVRKPEQKHKSPPPSNGKPLFRETAHASKKAYQILFEAVKPMTTAEVNAAMDTDKPAKNLFGVLRGLEKRGLATRDVAAGTWSINPNVTTKE